MASRPTFPWLWLSDQVLLGAIYTLTKTIFPHSYSLVGSVSIKDNHTGLRFANMIYLSWRLYKCTSINWDQITHFGYLKHQTKGMSYSKWRKWTSVLSDKMIFSNIYDKWIRCFYVNRQKSRSKSILIRYEKNSANWLTVSIDYSLSPPLNTGSLETEYYVPVSGWT